MRKLTIFEHISLDGVIQAAGSKNEDLDYPYGGWAVPFDDLQLGKVIVAAASQPHDLLPGRRTCDSWSGFWWKAPKSPIADGINAATKYVATHRSDSLKWGPVAGFGPDIVAGVRSIKAKNGPILILWGSSTLTSVLIERPRR